MEALSTARMSQSPYLLILYLSNLASVHADRGRWSESVALDREALELIQASGNRHFAPGGVLIAARILAASGDLPSAWRLAGAALGMWGQIGEAPPFEDVEWIERHFRSLGDDSGREDYARLQADGRSLSFDAAIIEALGALQRLQWPSPSSPAVKHETSATVPPKPAVTTNQARLTDEAAESGSGRRIGAANDRRRRDGDSRQNAEPATSASAKPGASAMTENDRCRRCVLPRRASCLRHRSSAGCRKRGGP